MSGIKITELKSPRGPMKRWQILVDPDFPKFMEWCAEKKIADPTAIKTLPHLWARWNTIKRPKRKVTDKRDYYRNVYLKSDHWKQLKGLMLGCFEECQVCHSRSDLDVHHRHYRNLYDVTPSDLIVLCRKCHNEIHSNMPKTAIGWQREAELELRLERLLNANTEKARFSRTISRFFNAISTARARHGINLTPYLRQALRGSPIKIKLQSNGC